MKKIKQELTYETAMEQLDQLLQDLETDGITVDGLSAKVKEAGKLIEFCQSRLKTTELEVKSVLKTFGNEDAEP